MLLSRLRQMPPTHLDSQLYPLPKDRYHELPFFMQRFISLLPKYLLLVINIYSILIHVSDTIVQLADVSRLWQASSQSCQNFEGWLVGGDFEGHMILLVSAPILICTGRQSSSNKFACKLMKAWKHRNNHQQCWLHETIQMHSHFVKHDSNDYKTLYPYANVDFVSVM